MINKTQSEILTKVYLLDTNWLALGTWVINLLGMLRNLKFCSEWKKKQFGSSSQLNGEKQILKNFRSIPLLPITGKT